MVAQYYFSNCLTIPRSDERLHNKCTCFLLEKKKFKSFYHTPFVAAEKLFIFKLNLTGSLLKFSFLGNKISISIWIWKILYSTRKRLLNLIRVWDMLMYPDLIRYFYRFIFNSFLIIKISVSNSSNFPFQIFSHEKDGAISQSYAESEEKWRNEAEADD